MKCKFEQDGHCCNREATQYMIECKQPCETIVTMTNADRIRTLTDEELEKFIQTIKTRAVLCKAVKNNDAFKELCSAEWLQQPAE